MDSQLQEVFHRHQHCPVLFKTLHIQAAFLSCPTATIATGNISWMISYHRNFFVQIIASYKFKSRDLSSSSNVQSTNKLGQRLPGAGVGPVPHSTNKSLQKFKSNSVLWHQRVQASLFKSSYLFWDSIICKLTEKSFILNKFFRAILTEVFSFAHFDLFSQKKIYFSKIYIQSLNFKSKFTFNLQNDAYNYRRDTSFFLQSNSGGNLPSEYASLSPVNEVWRFFLHVHSFKTQTVVHQSRKSWPFHFSVVALYTYFPQQKVNKRMITYQWFLKTSRWFIWS